MMKPKLVLEHGMSFEQVEELDLDKIGQILGYLSEKGRAEARLRERAQRK